MGWWVIGVSLAAFGVWYVYGLLTFRRGLINANVRSYFIRRRAGDDHAAAMDRLIATRYPESESKRAAIREMYADSRQHSPSEHEDLMAVIRYMYAFETGRVLRGARGAHFVDEIGECITRYERRSGHQLQEHTSP